MSISQYATPAVLAAILLCGCSADPPPPAETTDVENLEPSTDLTTNTDSVPSDSPTEIVVPPYETTPPVEHPEYATAREYVEAMQERLADSSIGPQQPPTIASINAAIAIIDRGRAKFPDDEDLLRGATVLRYQSLPFVGKSDPAAANERRLKLGEMARLLIERNKDSMEDLGNMPSILILEESKAYLAKQDTEKAWASVRESRALGFSQSELFFFDPAFASIVENQQSLAEIKQWLKEEAEAKIAAAESFPLEFTLRSLTNDEEVSLSDYKGKLVIVDFWGTWCPPCRAAIPHLVELAEKHQDELAVLGLNFERGAPFEEAKVKLATFLESQPINYPCLYGEREVSAQVPEFGSFPTMVFVDKSGTVRLSVKGYQPLPVLEATINALLSE